VVLGFTLRVEFITIPEAIFYLLVYLPRRRILQKPYLRGPNLSDKERRELFRTCLDSTPDIEYCVRNWFRGAPVKEIKTEDVREWLSWNFWNMPSRAVPDPVELGDYVYAIEQKLGYDFQHGQGPHRAIRPTVDTLNMKHRPLFYYICGVGMMDTRLLLKMWQLGFQHYPRSRWFQSFPLRPLSVLCRQQSNARDMSYWYRPHTSRTRMPILFIHGIGIGLITYTDFFSDLIEKHKGSDSNDQVGIIAIEIMPPASV